MVNLNVPYRRGNYGLQTLVAERIAKYGQPDRPSEYVTGYKSVDNYSGHNADSNGIVHAVDIFVGPGNLTVAQADDVAAAVIAEGIRGNTAGHPKRAGYVIWNRRTAGDTTGWQWAPYTGPVPHTDHLHISSIDLYYGDPLPAWYGPADYDSTLPWNLTTLTGQGSGITPIPSEEDDMFTDKDKANLETTLGRVTTLVAMLDNVANAVTATPGRVLDKQVPRANSKATTSLGLFLSYADADREATVARIKGAIADIPASDLAAEINAAGIAADVRDELVKLLGGDK